MSHAIPPSQPAALPRRWHPLPFQDRRLRPYRVSFLIAEEATWDHRVHDLDGREISPGELLLSPSDHQLIQASCDAAVGRPAVNLVLPAANGNASSELASADAAAGPV